jgi:ribonuclease P protein component
VVRLKRRSEFVAVAATGQRWAMPAFVLQAGPRPPSAGSELGVGFTASRRIGSAVARNRARRRLVAAVRQVLPGPAAPGYNYVVVARPAVLTWPFQSLLEDLTAAFRRVATSRPRPRRTPGGAGPAGS